MYIQFVSMWLPGIVLLLGAMAIREFGRDFSAE
jgi:hypothetical protein